MNNKKVYQLIMIGFLAIVAFSVTGLILIKKEKTKIDSIATKIEISPTPTIKTTGLLSLIRVNEAAYEIYADSAGLDIVGYDVLIDFGPQKTDVNSVISADPNFSIFKTQKNNLLIVTGAKKLTVKEPTVFSKTKILTIKGASAAIVSQSDKETTKFVDSASKINYPKITLLK